MKKSEVVIGGYYRAKVSRSQVVVKIIAESKYGGWEAINTSTNRRVRIMTGGRLSKISIGESND